MWLSIGHVHNCIFFQLANQRKYPQFLTLRQKTINISKKNKKTFDLSEVIQYFIGRSNTYRRVWKDGEQTVIPLKSSYPQELHWAVALYIQEDLYVRFYGEKRCGGTESPFFQSRRSAAAGRKASFRTSFSQNLPLIRAPGHKFPAQRGVIRKWM